MTSNRNPRKLPSQFKRVSSKPRNELYCKLCDCEVLSYRKYTVDKHRSSKKYSKSLTEIDCIQIFLTNQLEDYTSIN